MADLNPEQLRILQDLIEGFERLSARTRTVGDVFEQKLGTAFEKKMQAAADAAADLAKAQAAAALATVKNMKPKEREAAIEAAGKRAAAQVQREYDENTQAASRTLEQMAQAVTKLTRSIYAGEQGQKKYAEAVDQVVTALGSLFFLVGGPLTKAITTAVLGLTKMFKASVDMSDALFKNYQEISRFGGAAGDGIQGVYGLMQSMRLSTEQLGQLTQLISENAQGLALFRGTVFEGAKGLADLRKNVTDTGLELEAFGLGMTPQELNETMAAFINQQAKLGAQDVRTTDAATKSLRAYIYETDLITKLTGDSRKQQEEAMNRAMAIEQFRVKIAQLEREGTDESRAEAKRLGMTFKALNAVSPDLAAGFAQMTTGLLGPESVGAFLATQGRIFEVANARGMSFAESMDQIGQGLRSELGPGGLVETLGTFGGLNKTLGLNIAQLYNLGKITEDQYDKILSATTAMELQTALDEAGLKNMVKTQEADLDAMQSMQDFVKIGVAPATAALAGLAKTVETITSVLPKTGAQATGGVAGGVALGAAGAAKGAAIGTAIAPGVGTAAGGLIGGIVGGLTGFFGGRAIVAGAETAFTAGRPEEVLQFQGESGSREAFAKLDPELQKKVLAAGEQYFTSTGRKLQINSAFRTREKQQELYEKFLAGMMPYKVAPPGTSSHEKGQAVDIQNYNDPIAVAALNRQGLFQTVAGDLPHFSQQPGYLTGGIATGPRSGYMAQLHGTEAVIPLPDGKNVPVAMPEFTSSVRDQVVAMGEQTNKLDDLVSLMRQQVMTSQKLLQVSSS